MKKIMSIMFSVLVILSTVTLLVSATNDSDSQTETISMTVYDVKTGEETIEEYQIDTEIIQSISSKLVDTTPSVIMSSASIPQNNLCLLSGDAEFTNIGLQRVANSTLRPYSAIGLYKIKKELILPKVLERLLW